MKLFLFSLFKLLTFVFLIIFFFSCDKKVDCHPQLYLTIKNIDTSDCTINFTDKHSWEEVSINIKYSNIQLNGNDTITNVIDYFWKDNYLDGDCSFGRSIYDDYLYVVMTYNFESGISGSMSIFPWDTFALASYRFPKNCIHTIYDTITIP